MLLAICFLLPCTRTQQSAAGHMDMDTIYYLWATQPPKLTLNKQTIRVGIATKEQHNNLTRYDFIDTSPTSRSSIHPSTRDQASLIEALIYRHPDKFWTLLLFLAFVNIVSSFLPSEDYLVGFSCTPFEFVLNILCRRQGTVQMLGGPINDRSPSIND